MMGSPARRSPLVERCGFLTLFFDLIVEARGLGDGFSSVGESWPGASVISPFKMVPPFPLDSPFGEGIPVDLGEKKKELPRVRPDI